MNQNNIKLIKAAKIYVNAYVESGKAIVIDEMPYTDIDEESINLKKRDWFGQDYVDSFERHEDSWKCVCGKVNPNSEKVCPMCGRNFEGMDINEFHYYQTIWK